MIEKLLASPQKKTITCAENVVWISYNTNETIVFFDKIDRIEMIKSFGILSKNILKRTKKNCDTLNQWL